MTTIAVAEPSPPQFQVNQATGRLTRDPELRYLPDGTPVCQIRIAVEGMGRGGRDETGYINATQFGDPGLAAAKVLSTGWLVAVEAASSTTSGIRTARPATTTR